MDDWTDNPTIATYDRIAARYVAKSLEASPDFQRAHQARLARFAEAVAGNAPARMFRILDAGCGPGLDCRWFRERGFQVVGVDLSAGMLAEARRQVPEVACCRGDLRQLGFADGAFDGIWCNASLLHLPRADVPGVLRAFRRILGHGYLDLVVMAGTGVTVIDDQYGPDTPRVFTYFQRDELELALERAGFAVIDSVEGPWPGGSWPWIRLLARTTLETPLVGAMAVVVDVAGRVLLSERADGRGWNLPAGFVEARETPEEAVIRETREETGLEVTVEGFVGIYSHPYADRDGERMLLLHVFRCRTVGGELRATKEALRHGWFARDALPEPLSRAFQRDVIEDARVRPPGRATGISRRHYA